MQKNLLKINSFINNYQTLINEINSFENDLQNIK